MKNKGTSLIIVVIIYFILLVISFSLLNYNIYLKNNLSNKETWDKEQILKEYKIEIDKDFNFR
ncbi:hypothetical protein [Oceanivirga miroungae]|uniref:Uncharacterized protein n=1 Tax=Oceanivirga miroungae TaxID=1130046 RepID=A0A6I8M6D4_9FUSO|nr:hypothetical protein [Oceanivirga miroungae]VWL85450.1 hypothetical protein OMES3154_00735 [Oceanivirga miroungae]